MVLLACRRVAFRAPRRLCWHKRANHQITRSRWTWLAAKHVFCLAGGREQGGNWVSTACCCIARWLSTVGFHFPRTVALQIMMRYGTGGRWSLADRCGPEVHGVRRDNVRETGRMEARRTSCNFEGRRRGQAIMGTVMIPPDRPAARNRSIALQYSSAFRQHPRSTHHPLRPYSSGPSPCPPS